jgi:2-C-methyl-D-erythritol 4-phosphate cytidylyltransferase
LIIEEIKSITEKIAPSKPVVIVKGGKERQDSVRNGLNALPEDTDIVLIHDAVRPFVEKETLSLCAAEAFKKGAVIVMRPIKETVKTVENGIITGTIERSKVWAAQTPQAFRYNTIMEAHRKAFEDGFLGTDDSMLVERLGIAVHIIEGTERNIKITTPADLIIAGAFLKK